jgi:hypothetical protein
VPDADADARGGAAVAARVLFARPDLADSAVRAGGVLQDPLAVMQPGGREQVAWFVPVTVGELLAGFFVLDLDNTMLRWSSFQRREGTLTGCPDADDWLSEPRIAARATAAGAPGTPGRPYLSYEAAPDRIAWAVPFGARLVYVTGVTSWIGADPT